MIVHEKFAWVHVPKCGGRSIRAALLHYPGVVRMHMGHEAYFGHLPVIACVRDPWDYYLSLYSHLRSEPVLGARLGNSLGEAVVSFVQRNASLTVQLKLLAGWTGNHNVHVLRLEDGLEQGINALLKSWQLPPLELPHFGRSSAPPADALYTPELVCMIREAEAEVIEAFGYRLSPRDEQRQNPLYGRPACC